MRHQWESKRLDRLNFDEFGQWYNDGGLERAPWLELLDLRKWVLIDETPASNNQIHRLNRAPSTTSKIYDRKPPPISSVPSHDISILPDDPTVPPPPLEDALDTNFFDTTALLPMDSVRPFFIWTLNVIVLYASHIPPFFLYRWMIWT